MDSHEIRIMLRVIVQISFYSTINKSLGEARTTEVSMSYFVSQLVSVFLFPNGPSY